MPILIFSLVQIIMGHPLVIQHTKCLAPDQQEEKQMKNKSFNSMSTITQGAHQNVYGQEREQSGRETTPVKQ